MLALYRTALRLRRAHPASDTALKLDGPDSGEWFGFQRGSGLRCLVNFGTQPLRLDDDAMVLLSSSPLNDRAVPQDTAVWIVPRSMACRRSCPLSTVDTGVDARGTGQPAGARWRCRA
ncbi:DUF3459 domain-containing protein [Streptomyces sp. NPDC048304]|uniref:DUF3459 domain-containing protein n=1 Tax=Streptomyces sp. NPDC048304 TaxID=3154820 RepID=UPI003406F2CE